jgi:hypothetical protein
LVIGSPYSATCGDQCGLVSVLFSKKATKLPSQLNVLSLDWNVFGNMSYEWFGYAVKAKLGFLTVGAPQSRLCAQTDCQTSDQDIQSLGRVYIYKYGLKQPVTVFKGDQEFGQFGYEVDLSKQVNFSVIAVTSLTHESMLNDRSNAVKLNRAGIVELYRLDDTFSVHSNKYLHQESSTCKNQSTCLLATFKSDRQLAEFGNRVTFKLSYNWLF